MPKKKTASKRYFVGTELHRQLDMMTEVTEELYREHYLVSETYLLSLHEAQKMAKSPKRDALIASLAEPSDFSNGMMIGVIK